MDLKRDMADICLYFSTLGRYGGYLPVFPYFGEIWRISACISLLWGDMADICLYFPTLGSYGGYLPVFPYFGQL